MDQRYDEKLFNKIDELTSKHNITEGIFGISSNDLISVVVVKSLKFPKETPKTPLHKVSQ